MIATCTVTYLDLLRAARDLESAGLDREADHLRWLASCAVSGSVVPAQSVSPPALTGDDDLESDASDPLGPALRDAETAEDWVLVNRLLGALAGQPRPSRRAA